MLSTGEQVTIGLLAMALESIGVEATQLHRLARCAVLTDSAFTKARIRWNRRRPTCAPIWMPAPWSSWPASRAYRQRATSPPWVVAAPTPPAWRWPRRCKADECQIYTDVDGVYTTDPRVVPEARKLDTITFEEMLEIASLGSKVLQIRSVEFAGKYKVRLRVLSSLQDGGEGTLITFEEDNNMERAAVSGIAFNRDQARVNVLGVPDKPGIAYQILGPVADANIEVDMIIQNVGEDGTTDFSFTVPRADYKPTLELMEKLKDSLDAADIDGDDAVCKVSIVGLGMRSHVGVASKMFRTLAEEGINIEMISTSEIKAVGAD